MDVNKPRRKVVVARMNTIGETLTFLQLSPVDALVSAYLMNNAPDLLIDDDARDRVKRQIFYGEKTISVGDFCCMREEV